MLDNAAGTKPMAQNIRQLNLLSIVAKPQSPAEKRHADATAEIDTHPAQELAFLHTALASVCLPYRKPKDPAASWVRTNGKVRLSIDPGRVTAEDGSRQCIGVPFGSYARLIMLFLQSEAKRTEAAEIDLGQSLSAWMRRLGLRVTGGETGTISRLTEQVRRLQAATFTIELPKPEGMIANEDSVKFIRTIELWDAEDDQWTGRARLSKDFFESLIIHAFPVDERAVAHLKSSPLALDIYVWLAQRMYSLRSPLRLRWDQLQQQFGTGNVASRSFASNFKRSLNDVTAVYPDAHVFVQRGGIELRPSKLAVPESTRLRAVKDYTPKQQLTLSVPTD